MFSMGSMKPGLFTAIEGSDGFAKTEEKERRDLLKRSLNSVRVDALEGWTLIRTAHSRGSRGYLA